MTNAVTTATNHMRSRGIMLLLISSRQRATGPPRGLIAALVPDSDVPLVEALDSRPRGAPILRSAPPSSIMNARRLVVALKGQNRAPHRVTAVRRGAPGSRVYIAFPEIGRKTHVLVSFHPRTTIKSWPPMQSSRQLGDELMPFWL